MNLNDFKELIKDMPENTEIVMADFSPIVRAKLIRDSQDSEVKLIITDEYECVTLEGDDNYLEWSCPECGHSCDIFHEHANCILADFESEYLTIVECQNCGEKFKVEYIKER